MSGYFSESSIIRRVHKERVVAFSGARALLMQAAHPVAFAGFFASTSAISDPYPRLERTAAVMNTIIFGSRAAADRATARVRRVHHRMSGTLPEQAGPFPPGTPWAADDPQLLLWIIATLVDSSLLVYERYVNPLSADERQEYWSEYRVVAALFGLDDHQIPEPFEELQQYLQTMLASDQLYVSEQARELAIQIVLRPPIPFALRPVLELANFITVGLLPRSLREDYGLHWDPILGIVHRGAGEYVRRVLVPLLPSQLRYNLDPPLVQR